MYNSCLFQNTDFPHYYILKRALPPHLAVFRGGARPGGVVVGGGVG